jgi:hypothetical protein
MAFLQMDLVLLDTQVLEYAWTDLSSHATELNYDACITVLSSALYKLKAWLLFFCFLVFH